MGEERAERWDGQIVAAGSACGEVNRIISELKATRVEEERQCKLLRLFTTSFMPLIARQLRSLALIAPNTYLGWP